MKRQRTPEQIALRLDLSRPVMIHVCKDGTISYRKQGEKIFNGLALPVFSVNTVEEAEELQLLLCARQYTEHPQMPGKTWYRLSAGGLRGPFELEDLDKVTTLLRERYQMLQRAKAQRVPA